MGPIERTLRNAAKSYAKGGSRFTCTHIIWACADYKIENSIFAGLRKMGANPSSPRQFLEFEKKLRPGRSVWPPTAVETTASRNARMTWLAWCITMAEEQGV